MYSSKKIPLMTSYLLRKVLNKYKSEIVGSDELPFSSPNRIDINQIINSLHSDPSKRETVIKQLISLVSSYQIYRNQGLYQEAEQVELKLLHILGYDINC